MDPWWILSWNSELKAPQVPSRSSSNSYSRLKSWNLSEKIKQKISDFQPEIFRFRFWSFSNLKKNFEIFLWVSTKFSNLNEKLIFKFSISSSFQFTFSVWIINKGQFQFLLLYHAPESTDGRHRNLERVGLVPNLLGWTLLLAGHSTRRSPDHLLSTLRYKLQLWR